MGREKNEKEMMLCPVGNFFLDLEKVFDKKSKFLGHMNQSRLEFLKGIRSLLDEKIGHLEKKGSAKAGKRATKIKVG
ncbi:MAG: hypothetical protein JRJ02_15785 [Deltaproteobacteria bacterium]|nr:hypothetical protein [Deltaproteobacteria bacterium]